MEDDPQNDPIRRSVAERNRSDADTIRRLIDEELSAFKEDFPDGGPDVEWGDSKRLTEDDWILRQLFEKSGFNPDRMGHWRLLLGMLGEFYVDAARADTYQLKYTAAAIKAHTWTDAELDRLFDEAAELARTHQEPRWSLRRICEELIEEERFPYKKADGVGQQYELTTILRTLKKIIGNKREMVASGRFDDKPEIKEHTKRQLSYFKFNVRRSVKTN
jgi:hypothetical protein